MEKIVRIDIDEKEDLVEKYNKSIVSRDLIEYIIDAIPDFSKNDILKIVINTNIKNKEECILLITEGLKKEYDKCAYKYYHNNLKQILLFLIGILGLLIYTIVDGIILEELALVGVWVAFWNMIETELFDDRAIKKKKKKIKKMLSGQIVIDNV